MQYAKESRIRITHRFGAIHQLLNPANPMRVAPAPYSTSAPGQVANEDIFGITTSLVGAGNTVTAPASGGVNQDLIDLFGNFDVSDQSPVASTPVPHKQAQNPFDQTPVANGTAPVSPPKKSATPSPVVPSPSPVAPLNDPFAVVSTPNTQAQSFVPHHVSAPQQNAPSQSAPVARNMSQCSFTQQGHAPVASNVSQGSHAQQMPVPAPRNVSQGSYAQHAHAPQSLQAQQRLMGVHTSGAPVKYGNAQPQIPNASMPPQQNRPIAPQQYYQPNPSLQYAPTKPHPGHPPQLLPQQQYNQVRGGQHPPQQQYHQHPGQHQQSHPPLQEQYVAQQAPPAQPKKQPNLSQFDPFQ